MLGLQQFQQCVTEQIGVFTVIKSEAHFVKVGLQMLCANPMPRSNDAPLEQGECRFDRVGMNVSSRADIFFRAVIDGLMASVADSLAIRAVFVGNDHINIFRDVLFDISLQSAALSIFGVEEAEIAATLPDADDNLLVAVSESSFTPSPLASANKGFVNLDSTTQFLNGWDGLHCVPDAMAEIPCGAIVDSQHPFKLIRRHPLARLADQERSKEPFNQGQMRVMEHRVCRHRELVAA